ncbi:MAG: DNA polymerase I [Chloroflexi bacterium]|nr:DNA polymerase I [Chloroflexota bacterium]
MSPKKPSARSGGSPSTGSGESRPRLVVFDGHGIIYRAYYAFREPLTVRKTGEVVSAVFGFANTLLTVLDELKPTHVAVALDPPGPTFRHEKDATYKAQREAMPDDLANQLGRVRELIEAFSIPIYMTDGYEADDVLGALAKQAQEAGAETYLVTLDSDIVQLVGGDVKVFMMRPYQRDTVIYDSERALERYQVTPEQMADLKGLKGDSSDNISGVPGVGEKTAVKLIQQFGSIESLYERLDEVKPEKLRENLREHEEQARHSKEMTIIDTSAPVTLDLEACQVQSYDRQRVLELFKELEFKSLVSRLPESDDAGDQGRSEARAITGQEYRSVRTEEELDGLVALLASEQSIAIGTETSGESPFRSSLVGVSVSWAEGKATYVPVGHRPGLGEREQLSLKAVLTKLGPVLEDEAIEKVGHNIKFHMEVLANHRVAVRGVAFDTMIAAYLLGESGESSRPGSGSLGLTWLVSKRLDIEMTPVSDLLGSGAKQISMADVNAEQAAPFACADADMALRLRPLLEAELKAQDLWSLFSEMEMPLVSVLARMEQAGVAIDSAALRRMSRQLGERVAQLERDAYDSVGHEFNLGSPLQLARVLFEELGLPKTRRTKQGYTTDANALEGLRGTHDLVNLLLQWRQLTKLKSTYIDALPALVHPVTGRIHSNFNQTVAATGRLSSQDPNLQNIPVRTELGNAIRRAFVARDFGPKPILLAADYSQIELRILAHLSQDPALIEAFQKDEDIHAATASRVFGVPLDEVTDEQRRRAKVFNFGVLYGLGEFGLSTREGISREEAAEFIETYFATYPKVREWREGAIESCRKLGYAETLAGRKRLIPEIRSSNGQVRAAAERVAVNMPAQGAASDIIKIAMNRIDAELQERGLKTKMILQVHDELIFEGPTKEREDVQEMVLRIMPQSLELVVPLKVDVKVGASWGELEVVEAVAAKIREQYPGAKLAGYRDGYFTADEEPALVDEIRAARPDIIFVAMSPPKKEQFLARWTDTLEIPVCHGVGGMFSASGTVIFTNQEP